MNFIFTRSIALFLFLTAGFSAQTQPSQIPWYDMIISEKEGADSIHTLSAKADVSVSDGLTYTTHGIYQDPQRAAFQIIYPDRVVTQGVDGKYFWLHDGDREQEALPFYEEFVLGHQFFAQLLYFDLLHPEWSEPVSDVFEGQQCHSIIGKSHLAPLKVYYNIDGLPIALELTIEGIPPIVTKLENWQQAGPCLLPHKLIIADGNRIFTYLFTEVDYNQYSLDDLRLPIEKLTDEQQLLRLHRGGMDDHFFERITELQRTRDTTFYIVNRGSVDIINAHQFDDGMAQIMSSRDHTRYDDIIRPIVKISKDGTLGWVIVQVGVEGSRLNEDGGPGSPFNFVSAWIELYEKKDGNWKMIGNVSNFQDP